jgi:antitoxin (DNA-binding transcriptional repressor) of toxin-antitoxin stability system
MNVISMHQAKSNLSQLVKRAAAGETILIGAYGKAEAKLTAATATPASKKKLGTLAGTLHIPDDFDAPLDDDIIAEFEGR